MKSTNLLMVAMLAQMGALRNGDTEKPLSASLEAPINERSQHEERAERKRQRRAFAALQRAEKIKAQSIRVVEHE